LTIGLVQNKRGFSSSPREKNVIREINVNHMYISN